MELLKAGGFNAIRRAHNPPSPVFLDACDRLGMLVIDEAFDMWADQKNPGDCHRYFDSWWRGYLQETNFYPWNLAYCGDIDTCGWKRPQSYYRDVPVSLEGYRRPERKAWRGRCLAIIRAAEQPGSIVLKASAQGLEPAEVTVFARP